MEKSTPWLVSGYKRILSAGIALWITVSSPPFMQRGLSKAPSWSPQSDSNQRPADYKSAALPTELCGHLEKTTALFYFPGLATAVSGGVFTRFLDKGSV